jgi:hypothetical protein
MDSIGLQAELFLAGQIGLVSHLELLVVLLTMWRLLAAPAVQYLHTALTVATLGQQWVVFQQVTGLV